MKNRHFAWMLTAVLTFCGATVITSCSTDNEDRPVAPATDDVRLTSTFTVTLSPKGDTLAFSTQRLTWEGGLLKKTNTSIQSALLKIPIESEDSFVYEGTNCTEIIHSTGTHDTFTYADGRLVSAFSTSSDGNTELINITGYTADGHISELTRETSYSDGDIVKVGYTLTWQNGDLTSYVKHRIAPAGDDAPAEALTYYDVPSPFTGYPVGQYIRDITSIAFRGTKHYVKRNRSVQLENGRIVAETSETSVTYFTYSDGTGSALASAQYANMVFSRVRAQE